MNGVHVDSSAVRAAGVILVAASALFLVGAGLPPEPREIFSAPLARHLGIIHRHAKRWRLMNGLMMAAVAGTAVGLALFTSILTRAGDTWRSTVGLFAYLLGAVLWLVAMAFRHTATVRAAMDAERTGEIPGWLEPMQEWTGLMFWTYMVLAYASVALFGWAIVRSDLLGPGVGRFGVGYGYALGISFVVRFPKAFGGPVAEPPFLIHIPTLVFGIALLLR